MSTPRFLGALDWLELAGGLAAILIAYNENASSLKSSSIWAVYFSPVRSQTCLIRASARSQMLEDFKDEAMEKFASNITGRQNAGK